MGSAVVYWIHLKEHDDPFAQGYIGVTVNFKRRVKNHKREVELGVHANENLMEHLKNEKICLEILHEEDEQTCYKLEREYRPKMNVAWNIAPGGSEGGCKRSGYTLPEEFRLKRREHMRGNTIASYNKGKTKSEEHKKKIAASLKGKSKSEEQKSKQSAVMSGRVLTEEHKQKIRNAAVGKKRGPYRKKSYVVV